MNKAELIDAIAEKSGLTKVDAKKALDSFVGVTAASLKKGDINRVWLFCSSGKGSKNRT